MDVLPMLAQLTQRWAIRWTAAIRSERILGWARQDIRRQLLLVRLDARAQWRSILAAIGGAAPYDQSLQQQAAQTPEGG
ncbi:MAG: hypothetical protein ACKPKO_33995, partial [Candidatus Fonsibacter sp.]